MKPKITHILFFACSFITILNLPACKNPNAYGNREEFPPYNFTKSDSKITLPDILLEVSGITEIDNNTVACVQDENGILFIYDISKNEITKQYVFHIDGDYEGITRVENTIYILRSDGALIEILNYNLPGFSVSTYLTGIPADNNEGLCYDKQNNRLLIACKGKLGKGREFKDKRVIYAFDLPSKKLSEEPVYEFNTELIKLFAIEHKIKLPIREKKNKKKNSSEPIVKLRISAIGIHPLSGHLYVLSAADYMLLIFDRQGSLLHLEKLNETTFNKAEGITFMENNDLLITNEGQDRKPTLLRFNFIEK